MYLLCIRFLLHYTRGASPTVTDGRLKMDAGLKQLSRVAGRLARFACGHHISRAAESQRR